MADELADVQNENIASEVAPAEITPPSEPVVEASEKPVSLRDQISASVEEVRKAERARDEKGKFAPEPKVKEASEAAPKTEIPKTGTDAQPKPASTQVGPPPGWSAESKAFYNSLPPDHPIRKDVAKREGEISEGFKTKTQELNRYQEIEQAIAPVRQVFQQAGIHSDAEAIKNLLGWENSFRNPATRVQSFHNLARQYGVDLSQLAQGPSEPSTAQDIPAHLRPVLDQFGNIANDVQTLKSELQRRDQETISAKLSDFAKDKPHFEKVRVNMGKLMQAGLVSPDDLDGAYQKAISLDPEVSAAIAAEKAAADQAEQNRIQAEKAKNARLAAISPSVRAPSGPLVNGAKGAKPGVRGSILASIETLRGDQRA